MCQLKYGCLTMHDVQDVFGDSNQAKRDQVTTDSENMLGLLSFESTWSTAIDPKQVRIVFFIAGYVARSAMKSLLVASPCVAIQ
jgi:hypothetical protein